MKSISTSQTLSAGRKISEEVTRLEVQFIEPAKLEHLLSTTGKHPIAVISFGHTLPHTFSCPIVIDLPQIDSCPLLEVWTCDRPVKTEQRGSCSIAMNGEFLVGSISLYETPGTTLDSTTYEGYCNLFHQLLDLGYPYPWRAWNYIPNINEDQNGMERYRRFCVGRHQALTETLADFPSSLPAATAIGTKSGPLQIVVLAATQPAMHLGNPRQLNAYDYPTDYGPRSPAFARATFTKLEHGCLLFIAGTASVVGHMSQHFGLPYEQTKETIRNLHAVLSNTERIGNVDLSGTPHQANYKVYVRNPDFLPEIQRAFRDSSLAHYPLLFLQGDLCRKELLVEVEGSLFMD